MEDPNRQLEKKKFFEFAEAIVPRVSEIAAKKGSTVRSSDVVTEMLFRSTDGDASKVTDDDIAKAFDAFHEREDQKRIDAGRAAKED